MSERMKIEQEIAARPSPVALACESIYEGIGGKRGDSGEKTGVFAGNLPVKIADFSRDNSWTHKRFQVWLTTPEVERVEFRVVDGGSGADDPEQHLEIIHRDTRESWDYLSGEDQPEWVTKALNTLQLAQDELGASPE
ncbi:hypothetical protein KBD20_00850 [Candidatus Saccharibacteria bacterium]|nr:hypothetical protein [Candidatus Saccharibacteria bacterium]